MFKRKPSKPAKIQTLIGAKTRVDGDVEFSGGLHLDGHVNGNVRAAAGPGAILSISEQGCIEGSVNVPSIVLNGIVKGDIEALERVELGPKARVLGNVHYTIIEIAVGAQINGKLLHKASSDAPEGDAAPTESPAL
jgi:cytoskeletal protein CcmA (bactofilin family)